MNAPARIRTFRLGEPGRYLMVGGLCALIQNIMVMGGDGLGLHYSVSTILSLIVLIPTGYILHCAFTFDRSHSWQRLARFTVGIVAGFPVYFAIMFLLCTMAGIPVMVAAPMSTLFMVVWNYASARWAILFGR